MSDWPLVLQMIIGALTLVALAFLAESYWRYLRARYYFQREEGGQQAKRWGYVLVALLLALLAVRVASPWLGPALDRLAGNLISLFQAQPSPRIAARPSPGPAIVGLPSPVATRRLPTPTPSATPAVEERPSPTPTASPLPTPSPTSTQPPGQGPHIESLVLARSIDENDQPVDEGPDFTLDDRPVYVFFEYQDMRDGLHWSQEWFHEGRLLWRGEALWEWGQAGRAWVFFTPPYGWAAGTYEVRLFVQGRLERSAFFRIE